MLAAKTSTWPSPVLYIALMFLNEIDPVFATVVEPATLAAHYKTVSKLHLRQLFKDDPQRGERMAVEAAGLYLDYSKKRVTDETLKRLLQLAEPAIAKPFLRVFGEKVLHQLQGFHSMFFACGPAQQRLPRSGVSHP